MGQCEDVFAVGLICRFSVLSVLRATCRLPTTTYYYGSHCCNPQAIPKPNSRLQSPTRQIEVHPTISTSVPSIVFNICSTIFIFYFRASSHPLGIYSAVLCALKETRLINNFMKVLTWRMFVLVAAQVINWARARAVKVDKAPKSIK